METWSTGFSDFETMKSMLPGACAYNLDHYTEGPRAYIITSIIQKPSQQNQTQRLQHSFELPHLSVHPKLATRFLLTSKVLVKTSLTVCSLSPDSHWKNPMQPCAPSILRSPSSCAYHYCQISSWESVKVGRKNHPNTDCWCFPPTLRVTLISPMQTRDTQHKMDLAHYNMTWPLLGLTRKIGPNMGLQTWVLPSIGVPWVWDFPAKKPSKSSYLSLLKTGSITSCPGFPTS